MEETKRGLTRRDFLLSAGGTVAGIALAGARSGLLTPKAEGATVALPEYPWEQYFDKPLDVQRVWDVAVQSYGEGNGCAEGAFRALITVLGEPFSYVPSQVMNFGKAGGVGWGTLCGSINGAAAAVSLVYGRGQGTTVIVNELMGWYSDTALPLNTTESSVSNSPLCHASISNWCKATGKKASERGPRCKAVTGDTAAQAAMYMNQMLAGTFVPAHPMSAETKACYDCHGPGGPVDNTLGIMSCGSCHEPHGF